MRSPWATRGAAIAVLVALAFGLAPGAVLAGGFDDKDFSLRFPAALSRFSSYGDVGAAGGASAGSMWGSSVNPASSAWKPIEATCHVAASPQYSDLFFRNGTRVDVFTESATWDGGPYGTFEPALAQVRSNTARTNQGLDLGFDIDYQEFQWGRKFGDDWAFGASVSVSESNMRYGLGPVDVADSASESYGIRLGALHRVADHVLAGLVFDYGFSPSRTTAHDFMGLGIGDVRTEDTTHQFLLRPGVSWEYQKDSSIYLDYQFGSFFNDTGSLLTHRFFTGIDHKLVEGLFVRAGTALDTHGNAAWTTGLGIYPTDWFTIDVAYQNNMFPELRQEFGRSQTLIISLGFSF